MKKTVSWMLAVILAAGCLFGLAGCSAIFGSAEKSPAPMLYMDGDDLYMAVGDQTMLLDDAAVTVNGTSGTLRGEFSDDNQTLYYLADVSDGETAGTLMAADAKTMTKMRIADDVYLAKTGGDRVLYFTDAQPGMVGTLNVAKAGGQSERIADSVLSNYYGFSKNSKNIYYTTLSDTGDAENPYHFELFIKEGNNQAVKRLEGDGRGDTILETFFGQIVLGNGGQLLFTRMGTAEEQESGQYVLTLNANGNAEDITGNAVIVQTFENPDDFLYSVDSELYYKAPGAGEVRLSDDYSGAVFTPYYGEPEKYVPEKRFLLVESKTGEDGAPADSVTLYDQEIGKDKVKIISADPGTAVINPQFDAVCFKDGGKLCLMVKKGGEWGERISLCDNAMGWIFDRSGKNLYYIEQSKSDATDGDLIRYRLSDGQTGVLLYDAGTIYQTGVGIFSKTADGDMVWMDGSGRQQTLPEDTAGAMEAKGGYYAAVTGSAYDLIYFKTGAAEGTTLCYDAAAIVMPAGFASVLNVDASGSAATEEPAEDAGAGQIDSGLYTLLTGVYDDLNWYREDYADDLEGYGAPFAHVMDCDAYSKELSGWLGASDEAADAVVQSLIDCYEAIKAYEQDKKDTTKLVSAQVSIELNMAVLETFLASGQGTGNGTGTDDVQPAPTGDPVKPSPTGSPKTGLSISMAPSGRWESEVNPNPTTDENGITLETIDAPTIVFRNNLAYFGSSMNSSDDIIKECEAWKAGIATYEVGAGEITFTIDAAHNDISKEDESSIICQYDGSTIIMEGVAFIRVSDN